jgi:uncharacterized protein YgiB involved in biofilm formation
MIRAVVFLVIAGVAGLMGYVALVGECPGGAVVRSQEQCNDTSGFSRDICAAVFARALDVARNAGTVYTDRNACFREFGNCLDHATVVGGHVPQPAGFCVKVAGGTLAAILPVYRGAAAR